RSALDAKCRYRITGVTPASAAMASRLVLAKPARANARVAASRICSRRSARGIRRGRSGAVVIGITPCLWHRIQLALYMSTYTLVHVLGGGGDHVPFGHPHPVQLAPTTRELQSKGGVPRVRTAVGHEAWLVTDYNQVRRL